MEEGRRMRNWRIIYIMYDDQRSKAKELLTILSARNGHKLACQAQWRKGNQGEGGKFYDNILVQQ